MTIDKHEMIVDRYDFEDMQAENKANKEKIMLTDEFIRKVSEIAFGADAADREFTREDVLQRLRELSDTALKAGESTASRREVKMSNFNRILSHIGHKLEVAVYGDNESVAIECLTCMEVVADVSAGADSVEQEMLEEVEEE